MKKYLFPVLLLVSVLGLHAQKAESSNELLARAYKQAAVENKNVFVIFHASWCVWCRKMDSSINDPSVKAFFDKNYVIVHLTVQESADKKNLENPGAQQLLVKNGGEKAGLPFWLIVDKEGNTLADAFVSAGVNSGCPASAEEVKHFIGVLIRTSKSTPDQITAVEKRFRRNE